MENRSKTPSSNGHIYTYLYNCSINTYYEPLAYEKKGVIFEVSYEERNVLRDDI